MTDQHLQDLITALKSKTSFVLPTTLNHIRFWIKDENTRVELSVEAQKNWLRIENTKGEDFIFLRVDGSDSIFGSSPPVVFNESRFIYNLSGDRSGACDCLLVDLACWHFVEFKIESYTENLEQIQENRRKATLQISRTITFFRENLPNWNAALKAVIVVPNHYGYPRFRSDKSAIVKFKLQWKATLKEVPLKEGYSINI
jgi:hypothetical protein